MSGGDELVYAVPRRVFFDGIAPWLGVKREARRTACWSAP